MNVKVKKFAPIFFVGILALILVGAYLYSNHRASQKLDTVLDQPYQNEAGGYTIRFPKGWIYKYDKGEFDTVEFNSPDTSPWILPPEEANDSEFSTYPGNMISAQAIHGSPKDAACHGLEECALHLIDNTYGGIKNPSITKTRVGTYDARLIEFDAGGTITRHQLILMVYKGDQMYTVDASFDSYELWEKYEDVVRESLSTFAFTNL
jgi:hypothetical protein